MLRVQRPPVFFRTSDIIVRNVIENNIAVHNYFTVNLLHRDSSLCSRNNIAIGFPQVKIWFQNHRYKCKRQAKEKAMAEQNAQNQVR